MDRAAGVVFGAAGPVGMMTPLRFAPGVIYDGRSIVLSLAGLSGGPVAAAVAAVMCGTYRLLLAPTTQMEIWEGPVPVVRVDGTRRDDSLSAFRVPAAAPVVPFGSCPQRGVARGSRIGMLASSGAGMDLPMVLIVSGPYGASHIRQVWKPRAGKSHTGLIRYGDP